MEKIRLSEAFIEKYRDVKPKFGPLGWVTYKRTYARWIEEEGRTEEWFETVRRVIEGNFNITHMAGVETVDMAEMERAYHLMFNFCWLPPGRGLWQSGTAYAEKHGDSLYNCWQISTKPHKAGLSAIIPQGLKAEDMDPSFAFRFMLDISTKGGGVGFNAQRRNVQLLPVVKQHVDLKIVCRDDHPDYEKLKPYLDELTPEVQLAINEGRGTDLVVDGQYHDTEDAREGWVEDTGIVMLTAFNGNGNRTVVIDISDVRENGALIKTFGGVSAGPLPLVIMLREVVALLNSRVGMRLTTVDAVDLENIVGKCVVSGGVRRCLPEGTLVHAKRGLVPIEQINLNDQVMTAAGYAQVTDWVYQGEQDITVINTQDGTFECTDKHRIAVMSDTQGGYVWKRANQLVPGDRMVFVSEAIEGEALPLPSFFCEKPLHSTTCKDITIPELDEEMAWFLGYFHGDGYVGNENTRGEISVAVHRDEADILDKVVRSLSRFGVEARIQDPSEGDGCFKVRVKSRQLGDYLRQFKQSKTPIVVPDFIMRNTADIRASYVAGLADADGSFAGKARQIVVSVYPEFVKQVQALLASLGVPSRFSEAVTTNENWQQKYQLCVVGEKAISLFEDRVASRIIKYENPNKTRRSAHGHGFPREMVINEELHRSQRKWSPKSAQMTVATLERISGREVSLIPVEVVSIQHEVRTAKTYDISVDSRHEFVAQGGYLVHNTAQIAGGDIDDPDFITMKQDQEKLMSHRWASNNSVAVDKPEQLTDEIIHMVAESIKVNGEPGVVHLWNTRHYGRMIDGFKFGIDGKVEWVNPCSEIGLEDGEACNLVEIFPYICLREGVDIAEVARIATRYAKRVTFVELDWEISREVMYRNRRIGVSLSGIQDWALIEKDLQGKLDTYYQVVFDADGEFSGQLGCDRSIKLTAIKPSGSISLLAGVSPGMHWHYAAYFIRRITFQEHDPLLPLLASLGFRVELSAYSKNAFVVEFPVKAPTADMEGFLTAGEVPLRTQLEFQKLLQWHWADNLVSCTATFREEEKDQIEPLLKEFLPQLKSTSLLPYSGHGYVQAPYEPITEEEYQRRLGEITEWPSSFEDKTKDLDMVDQASCESGGACPIR